MQAGYRFIADLRLFDTDCHIRLDSVVFSRTMLRLPSSQALLCMAILCVEVGGCCRASLNAGCSVSKTGRFLVGRKYTCDLFKYVNSWPDPPYYYGFGARVRGAYKHHFTMTSIQTLLFLRI